MWIVCQIGAREHYAIPRALQRAGLLAGLVTDFWVPAGSVFGRLPGGRRLKDRFHAELTSARVFSPNRRMLGFEVRQRFARHQGWGVIQERNCLFQKQAIAYLQKADLRSAEAPTLFSYSYAAGDLFRWAKERGWTTVLGQIDPGPEEERIVAEEHRRYPSLGSRWQPAPASYWETWREELDLADRILVNSEWARECLFKEGVPAENLEVVPLVYESEAAVRESKSDGIGGGRPAGADPHENADRSSWIKAGRNMRVESTLRVLFLGQINLRKGIGRLLDAMRLLKDEPIELVMAGPSEINPAAWADLPNVNWLGPVPRSEVDIHYDAADVFILPTLSDGYALTQLEALSRGLPVIASRHCGAAVVDRKNGWILRDLHAETIAQCLRDVRGGGALEVVRPPAFGLDQLSCRLLRAKSGGGNGAATHRTRQQRS